MDLSRILTTAEAIGLAAGVVAAVLVGLAALAGIAAWGVVLPAALVVAVVVATGARGRRGERAIAQRQERRAAKERAGLDQRIDALERQLREVQATASFSAMDVPYPLPLGGWALDHEAAAVLAREVATGAPGTVVELGSGSSTLVIGLQLARTGSGHLWSLEHDPGYADSTRRDVAALGLGAVVSVLDAPLAPLMVNGETFTWYTVPAEVAALPRIDLLLVDGPPGSTDRQGIPRYPALPVFRAQLSPGGVVLADDAGRVAEQRMLERWAAEAPELSVESIATHHGLAILRVPPGA